MPNATIDCFSRILEDARQRVNRLSLFMVVLLGASPMCWAEEAENPDESQNAMGIRIDEPEPLTLLEGYSFQKLLAEEIDSPDVIWLGITYPNFPDSFEILGLEQASRLPNAQGAVLLLHDKADHADWPGALRTLRQTLPDSGWHTLSISLPVESKESLPARELPAKAIERISITPELQVALQSRSASAPAASSDKSAPENDANGDSTTDEPESSTEAAGQDSPEASVPNDAIDAPVDINLSNQAEIDYRSIPYNERALTHIEAGMRHLADRGYLNNIIIAFGQSAQSALEYIQPKSGSIEAQGFALILVDAKLEKAFNRDIGLALGKEFQAPVLDLVDSSNTELEKVARRRLTMAKVAKARTYQQVMLPSIQYGRAHKTLFKRIDAWLKIYAPGMSATSVKDF